jgi:hypothetical protein
MQVARRLALGVHFSLSGQPLQFERQYLLLALLSALLMNVAQVSIRAMALYRRAS